MAKLWTSLALAPSPRRGYGSLFDETYRDARVAIEREQDVAALLHDVGLNPFRWLVENQQRRNRAVSTLLRKSRQSS